MLKIKRILFPTDFSSCSNHALQHALGFAKRHGAEIHVLHVLVLHAADPSSAARGFNETDELHRHLEGESELRTAPSQQQLQEEWSSLEAATEKHNSWELKVEKAQRRGVSAAPLILDYAAENDIDLIVMGTHGRRGFRRWLLGSVAAEVVRLAPYPVLCVPQRDKTDWNRQLERVVVPVDFSVHSRTGLAYARELGAEFEATLQLLHVIEKVVYPDFYGTLLASPTRIAELLKVRAEERLRTLLSEVKGPDAKAEIHVKVGPSSGSEIVDFSEEQNADLIVIGSHGLTGLRHFFLGSVAEKVIHRAGCPVFIVKMFGKNLLQDS